MKIAFIEETAKIGGAEFNLLAFLERVDQKKIEPIVVCPCEGEITAKLKKMGVKFHVIKMQKLISTAIRLGNQTIINPFAYIANVIIFFPIIFKLKKFLLNEGINLIHTNCLVAHIYGGIAARLAGIPVVWHVQDIISPALAFGLVRKIFVLLAKLIPTQIVVISKSVGEMFSGHKKDKVILVYNAVDLLEYKNKSNHSIRKELGITSKENLVGIVGRLVLWKGHKDFIQAAKIVIKENKNVKFLIVGDAIFEKRLYFDQLKKMVEDLNLSEKVIFTGLRSDVVALMQTLDIFVLASNRPEPFGRVLIEAMAAGKPTIATNGGGVPEIVIDNVTGFLIPPSDHERMAIKILELINDSEKRNRFGAEGKKRVKKLFNIEEYVEKFTELYFSLYLKK